MSRENTNCINHLILLNLIIYITTIIAMYPYILIFAVALIAILVINHLSDKSDKYYIVPTRSLRMNVGSGKLLPSNTLIKRYISDN